MEECFRKIQHLLSWKQKDQPRVERTIWVCEPALREKKCANQNVDEGREKNANPPVFDHWFQMDVDIHDAAQQVKTYLKTGHRVT